MNHLIDTDPQDPNSDDETIVDPESCRREDTKHSKLLDILIEKSIKRLEDKSYKPRIRDVLKAIQLKQEVVKTSEAEKIFWQEIEAIRKEELPKLYPQTPNLEAQIQNTIIGLKHLVRNGILPVRIITDTFNQGRSKESQLTYPRLGRILSTMGFRKTKTSNGSSAIIWDDQLLPQHTLTSTQNSCPEACPEEKSGKK